jgi:type IV pilus assembly protein PilM
MARSPYAWGIDIGKCALKAMRCRMATDSRKLVAEGFDYIEYPMILTQPDADPVELVRAALEEFTARNDLRGDRVAVAVPGQSGLSKFIKLPPIEAKKIPDIVKYEARQQIPFPLEQVIWDWQRLAGGMEESGFVLDAEVAIFAMKGEQVFKSLEPLMAAGVEVDVLQLSPIALSNLVMFDQLPPPDKIDPDNPPPSIVLVSAGVDSTDIVVTNGLKIWQRSMPIGGSNFTKALVQGMKLTFAKAEHLKRNAVRAEDPKKVFTMMRPVFQEFTGELQRSLNYFTGSDRTATIGKVLLLGNATKLRGLTDFIGKQLQLDVQRLDAFRSLEGPGVLSAPTFRENRLAFGTAYGLALQAAGGSFLRTNLLPKTIVQERLIEGKKPWALAALLGLMAAALIGFAGTFLAWTSYAPKLYERAFAEADGVKNRSQALVAALQEARQQQADAISRQQYLLRARDRRFQLIDMVRAVETLLPRDEPGKAVNKLADRQEIHIDKLDCEYFPDLAAWFAGVKHKWAETHPPEEAAEEETDDTQAAAAPPAADDVAAGADPAAPAEAAPVAGPQGPGWVIELTGHHFHNEDDHKPEEGAQFVRSTIVRNLLGEGRQIAVSTGPLAGQLVPVASLGIGFPVIVDSSPVKVVRIQTTPGGEAAAPQPGAPAAEDRALVLKRYDFVLQFSWQPTIPSAPKQ